MTAAARLTVRHAGTNYGPYSLAEVNQLLIAGRIDREDLAWQEGAPEWQRLSAIPGVIAVPPPPPAPPSDHPSDATDEFGEQVSRRLVLPAFLMAFLVGPFGVHRFYCGKNGSAIAMLLLTLTVVGAIISIIWATIDWIMIVAGMFEDEEGRVLKRWT